MLLCYGAARSAEVIRSGSSSERSPALPAVPTTKEAGLIDAEYAIWFGLFAPVKTPDVVIERLSRETLTALATP